MTNYEDTVNSVISAMYRYPQPPEQLVLGVDVWLKIQHHAACEGMSWHDSNTDQFQFRGVPVEVVYDDPKRIKVRPNVRASIPT